MTSSTLRSVLLWLVPTLFVCAPRAVDALTPQDRLPPAVADSKAEQAMQVHYLEIVTPEMDATCSALEKLHGVSFSEPVAEFGNARTAAMKGGGRIGVRAPMRADEEPVVRPYVLVDDIEAAVEAAQAAGGEIALPPMEIPDQGKFAIYIQGGINHGLWQL